ncbi:MAG: hypothetical protein AAFX03_13445 [Pseudomonadota bacterium]
MRRTLVAMSCATLLGGFGAAAQDELMFNLDDAPAEALAAAQAAAPDATFEGVDVEVEEGVVTLEFIGVHADGRAVEVDVTSGWTVLEVEDLITWDETPDLVKETLTLQMGADFTPSSIERSMRGDAVIYEFEGVDEAGREIDIEIQADGESVVVLDDKET